MNIHVIPFIIFPPLSFFIIGCKWTPQLLLPFIVASLQKVDKNFYFLSFHIEEKVFLKQTGPSILLLKKKIIIKKKRKTLQYTNVLVHQWLD